MRSLFGIIGLLFILLLGCTIPDDNPYPPNPNKFNASVISASNQFAFQFIEPISSLPSTDSFLYSPLSIRSAFGLAYLGAKGNTAREISDVFNFEGDQPQFLAKFSINRGYKLSVASSLWVDQGFSINPDYISKASYYGASVYNSDLQSNRFVDESNEWVSKNTNGMIPKLLNQPLSKDARLMILNAVYFKGKWVKSFNPDRTREDKFYNPILGESTVEYMVDERVVNYSANSRFEMVALPYKGGAVMYIMKPTSEDYDTYPIPTYDDFTQLKSNFSEERLELWIPKFSFETPTYSLKDPLTFVGIKEAFTPDADFSGIANNLLISEVLHKAKIRVDEEGTEAAAVTEVIVGDAAMPPPDIFRADHPFYYVIEDPDYGILFIGRFAGD